MFLNLTKKSSNRSLVLLLELSLLLHTSVFIWIKLRQIFLEPRSCNHLYGWGILTIYFWFGRMENQNLKSLRRDLIVFCPTFNLHTSRQKKRISFLDFNVSVDNGSVTTDLQGKSTDCHQYLHCSSSHPDHIKKLHHLQSNVGI